MRRLIVGIALFVAACGSQPPTAEQQWAGMPEWCHKVRISTGPVSVAPKDWKPAETTKLKRYRAQQTAASKDYVAKACGAYPGAELRQS